LLALAGAFRPGLASVVIPCFNAERFLAQAIDSALAQSYRPTEVVVVDDGSTDGSLEIARGYGSQVVCINGPNRGACSARNDGLAASSGEYVQFLDADDLLAADALERRVLAFRPDVDAVFGDRGHVNAAGEPLSDYESPHIRRGWESTGMAEYALVTNIHTLEPLHRRSSLCAVGGFDESLPQSQETDLHFRLCLAGYHFDYQPGVVGYFRQHDLTTRIGAVKWWQTDPDRYIRTTRHWRSLAEDPAVVGDTAGLQRAFASMLCYHSVQLAARGERELARHYCSEVLMACPGFRPHGLPGLAARWLGLWPTVQLAASLRRAREAILPPRA
jgi:glycosyltransferase involved in cell wall biosynthesis